MGRRIKVATLDYDSGDDTWHIIDPSDPSQAGFWRVPFDSSITNDLSAYNFFSHGISSALNLQNGNFGFYHPLANSGLSLESSVNLINDQWYHLHKQIDQENGVAKLLSMEQRQFLVLFDPSQAIESDIESDWLVGTCTISSILDEIRISGGVRSDDWIVASYQNQMENPLFPTYPGNLDGPPSFLTAHDFTIFAETEFTHFAKATEGSHCLCCKRATQWSSS